LRANRKKAHVGQDVEVYYRWHALHGHRVRCQHSEQREAGRVIYLETAPGEVIVAAAWILDSAVCARMGFGAPRVAVSALVDLHQLLTERGFRRSSGDDPTIVQEEQDEKPAGTGTTTSRPVPTRHAVRFRKTPGVSPAERRTALGRLAKLLLEAAGFAAVERDDDKR
jgi:hypothetical protein